MLREKSKRSLQVHRLLRSVREMLGLQGFLLCALALTPKKIQSMTKADATNFPYILKRWWEDSWPSSKRLKAIAETLKTVDEQIPYIPLAHEMDGIKCSQSSITGQTSKKDENLTPKGQNPSTDGHVKSTILPLTIQGAEILLKALKEGDGEEVLVTLPHKSGYFPFITIPIPMCVKIMQAYTS